MLGDRISIVGIQPKTESIGPEGLHLRWSFPPHMGFPAGGFNIYRRPSGMKPKQGVSFTGLPVDQPLPPEVRLSGVRFISDPVTTQVICRTIAGEKFLAITPSSDALLELRFPQPVVQVRLGLGGVNGPSTLRAYSEDQLIAQIFEGVMEREARASVITRVTIELSFTVLRSVTFTTEADACTDSSWGAPVKHLPLPDSPQQTLSKLEAGLRNYYVGSADEARLRYEAGLPQMIGWLKKLQTPTATDFENPILPPHLLKIRGNGNSGISGKTYPQSLLLLAALDPNIARLLSLYWVDVFKGHVQGDPQPDSAYDYKIEGVWPGSENLCGLLFNLGLLEAGLPSVKPDLKGEQLPGLWWQGRKALGRVGLRWPQPESAIEPEARAVQPVLYDLTRTFENKTFRSSEPILVPNSAWKDEHAALFVDNNLALGQHVYEVRPIDLFGQSGLPIESDPITVRDNIAPPPPVRLRTMLSLPAASHADLQLQFEYGALQHQQAPDVKEFQVYWRPDSLLTRSQVRVEVRSRVRQQARFVYTLRLQNLDGTALGVNELKASEGGVLANVPSSADQPLPAGQRRRYRIAEVIAPDGVVLEPTDGAMLNGIYELSRDPHNRANWLELAQSSVVWLEPVTGVVQDSREALPVEVRAVNRIASSPDPFASLPEDQRRLFPNLPPAQDVVEVRIDRNLIEPDLFTGGSASGAGANELGILYAVSSGSSPDGARVGFPADAVLSVGQSLTLTPRQDIGSRVRLLTITGRVDEERLKTPGGEIAFEEKRDDEEITHIARVISSAVNKRDAFDLLVRFASEQVVDAVQPGRTPARYYAPYRVVAQVSLTDQGSAPITLPIRPDAGSRDGFIAVSASDERVNEGPLSTPVQFSVIKPPPSGAPSRPYPCGTNETADAGYATPPDRQGRATICLEWNASSLNPSSGLLYEVARALDNTILAAHLRNWQLGKPGAVVQPPLVNGAKVHGDLSNVSFDSGRGLYRAVFTPSVGVSDPVVFRNGRLSINSLYFEVTLAKGANSTVEVLLRSSGRDVPTAGPASMEAPPDYSAVREDIAALQRLAEQNPEAFGMATGVPVAGTNFTDEVAGIGRNRFFYRVRSVDAAGNRSAWSPLSAPFYQLDTTPPEAPTVSQVSGGDRQAVIGWLKSGDPTITRYELYRATDPGSLDLLHALRPTAEVTVDVDSPKEFIVVDEPLPGLLNNEFYYYRLRAFKTVPAGADSGGSREIASELSEIIKVNVFDTEPPAPPVWITATWWDDQRNVVADATTVRPVVLMEWATEYLDAKCFVFHSARRNNWVRLSNELTGVWVEAAERWLFRFVDVTADPSSSHLYRVQLRNRLGVVNVEYRERFVPPFVR